MDSISQVASSVAQSQASVTRSEVSQVGFKFQSNAIKKKLRNLLKKMDVDKTGMVSYDVFFQLLNLHQINISSAAVSYLKKNYSKNQTLNYKEAVNQLTIDLDAAGRVQEDGETSLAEMKWTVFALCKPKAKVGGDSVSQVSGSWISQTKRQ